MKPKVIISGGQTGADQGGLEGAFRLGIKTGGQAPLGYRTDAGPNPALLKDKYGLSESEYDTYPPRTEFNVKMSYGTLWVGRATSPGGKLTHNLCLQHGMPIIDNPTPEELTLWVEKNEVDVLNVAGNREQSSPGIHDRTMNLIIEAFRD